ncbi:MAG: SIS domain-containing protein [Elusimicrobiota bacterium]
MERKEWFNTYLEQYKSTVINPGIYKDLSTLTDWVYEANKNGKKTIFAGNGGSAVISSHAAVDFTKTAAVRAINFNEGDLITCLGNDYGYEWWVQKAIEFYADPGDVIVLISSSGKSPNIINAAKYAKEKGFKLATFSGFAQTNPLNQLGNLNFWVNSQQYNVIENTHLIWILAVCDIVIAEH